MEPCSMEIDTYETSATPFFCKDSKPGVHWRNAAGASASFPFLSLPPELQFEVIKSITNPLDVLSMSLACKQTYMLTREDIIWKRMCSDRWTDITEQSSLWKKYFYERNVFLSSKPLLEWQEKDILSANTELPPPRQSFTGTYINGKVVYIGGQMSVRVRFDDIYVFDPATKTFEKPTVRGNPPKFARHSSVAVGNDIYVFGGYDGFGTFFGLSVLHTLTWTWETPIIHGDIPIPRTNHALTAVGDKLYLFGGNDTTSPDKKDMKYGTYDDFSVYDTTSRTWYKLTTKGNAPCGRSGHHMVAIDNKIFLFGGGLWNDTTKSWIERYNDMFVYDTVTNEWKEMKQNNSPNYAFISLPHWTVGYFIFVYNDPVCCFDTITQTWHTLNTKGRKPQKRFLGPASYVPTTKEVFMFGGVYAEVMNDFDKLSWPCSITDVLMSECSDAESGV